MNKILTNIKGILLPHRLIILGIWILVLMLYLLTFRGSLGNPTPNQIDNELNSSGQVFETSQERSRYALILSLYYDRSFAIDNYASMGTPDIGYILGHYYSFFPPGASVLALPLFILGEKWGFAQMAVFTLPVVYSIATMLLIMKFCSKLGLHWSAGLFAAIAFGFATNAWGYSVTFYAHVISAFFILLGLYCTVFTNSWKGALLFWISYSLAVYIDFPNLFIFLPLALMQGLKFFSISEISKGILVTFKWTYLLTPFIFIFLMLGYGYYNYLHFGDPFTLSNTIPRVKDLKDIQESSPEGGREAVGALHTRNMLEGFRSFIISTDRGLLIYTPIAFLAAFGVGAVSKKRKQTEVLLLTVPLTCLVLYTMFGDPYGGWAFGSRYVLAVMPELMILAAVGLNRYAHNIWIKILFSLVFLYSSAVSALAPLTTNVIPPLVEARGLGLEATYIINIKMLQHNELNSFFYNHILNESVSGMTYYLSIAIVVGVIGLLLIWLPKKSLIEYEK